MSRKLVLKFAAGLLLMACAMSGQADGPRPDVWRQVGRLVPGDQFDHDDGNRYLIVGDGFEPLRDGPGGVVVVELGTGRLQKFSFGERVRWVVKSRQAVRDWDDERGTER